MLTLLGCWLLSNLRKLKCYPGTRTRGSGHKLKHRKFQLNMGKNFITLRVTAHWNRLPGEAVDSPSLEIFRTRLDKVLCSLLWVTMLRQGGWTRWPKEEGNWAGSMSIIPLPMLHSPALILLTKAHQSHSKQTGKNLAFPLPSWALPNL